MKTTFEKLIESKICFAVVVAVTSLRNGAYQNQRDYFILAHRSDKETVYDQGISFFNSKDRNMETIEHTMNAEEVQEFKSMQAYFIKTTSNKSGRVYEIRGNSFKEYYESKK